MKMLRKVLRQFSESSNRLSKYNGTLDATSVFVESVSKTIKGISSINYIEEWDPSLTEE